VRPHLQCDTFAEQALKRGHNDAAALSALLSLLLLAALPNAARGDWTLGAEANLKHDSNVGNAQSSDDKIGDSSLAARLTLFRLFPLDDGLSITVGGDLDGEVFRKLTGLNNGELSGEVALKKKWGLGAFVPWARAGLSIGRSSYDDSYRNAWIYRATLASGQRLDERWSLWAEYAFERRAADPAEEEVPGLSGDAFSQTSHNLGLHLEYSLSERTFLGLGLLARHGDVVSTAEPGAKILDAAHALAEDPAFGPEAYAYRLTGTTFGYRLSVNFAATQHSVLGCGFEQLDTRAYESDNYTNSIAEVTWDYRF
jgi:hypothetical protein